MPTDVIARACVEIQRISMRIRGRRALQSLAHQLAQPADQGRRTIQIGNERRPCVNDVAADTAALFVPGQVVAVDRLRHRRHAGDQFLGHRGPEEFGQEQKRSLPYEIMAQGSQIKRAQMLFQSRGGVAATHELCAPPHARG